MRLFFNSQKHQYIYTHTPATICAFVTLLLHFRYDYVTFNYIFSIQLSEFTRVEFCHTIFLDFFFIWYYNTFAIVIAFIHKNILYHLYQIIFYL